MSETLVGWTDELLTGNAKIDGQHKMLFQLLERMEAKVEVHDVHAILTEISHYIATHLFDEEDLMVSVNYPDLPIHKIEHEKIMEEVLNLSNLTDNEKISSWVRIKRYMKEWLRIHILEHDLKFSRFMQDLNSKDN